MRRQVVVVVGCVICHAFLTRPLLLRFLPHLLRSLLPLGKVVGWGKGRKEEEIIRAWERGGSGKKLG